MNFLRRIFYTIPGLPWLYHFSWSFLGAVVYGFPSRDIFVIGITGTKGKTTVIELLNHILENNSRILCANCDHSEYKKLTHQKRLGK